VADGRVYTDSLTPVLHRFILTRFSLQRYHRRPGDLMVGRGGRIVGYGLTFTLKHILIGQHDLALSLHNTAKNGNQILDEHLATVCLLRNEKICAINTYLSDVEMVNAFFV